MSEFAMMPRNSDRAILLGNVKVQSVLNELWSICSGCHKRVNLLNADLHMQPSGRITVQCPFCGDPVGVGISRDYNKDFRTLKKAVISLINEYRYCIMPERAAAGGVKFVSN